MGYEFDQKTSIFLGPEFGYLLQVQSHYGPGQNYDDSKGFPSKLDIGVNIGLRYMVVKRIGVELRYDYGLNTLYTVDAVGSRHVETNGAHRVFQVGLNYHFNN